MLARELSDDNRCCLFRRPHVLLLPLVTELRCPCFRRPRPQWLLCKTQGHPDVQKANFVQPCLRALQARSSHGRSGCDPDQGSRPQPQPAGNARVFFTAPVFPTIGAPLHRSVYAPVRVPHDTPCCLRKSPARLIGRVTEPSKATHDACFPASDTVRDGAVEETPASV